jgi:hypothetical protein
MLTSYRFGIKTAAGAADPLRQAGPIESVLGDMPRTYLIFGDIEGKLDVLRVECTKCYRKGRYSVAILIDKYGRTGDVMKWEEQLNADCPKRDGRLNDRCDLVMPDLPKGL